jgi:hypothetical protein
MASYSFRDNTLQKVDTATFNSEGILERGMNLFEAGIMIKGKKSFWYISSIGVQANSIISIAHASYDPAPAPAPASASSGLLIPFVVIITIIITVIVLYRITKRKRNEKERKTHDEFIELKELQEKEESASNNTIPSKINDISTKSEKTQFRSNQCIFISYRRNDSADISGRIYDRIVSEFGKEQVFKDVDSIPIGADFREYIGESILQSSVLLVVIGNNWLGESKDSKNRRIDDPNDYSRIEVSSALKQKIPIIPLLVSGATMPNDNQLPDEIKDLAFRNATPVRHDPDFNNDIDRLVKGLRKLLNDE